MCVIVVQPKGKYLDKDTAVAAWGKNPDGGGYAYVDDNGNMVTFKSMEFNSFWSSFEQARSTNRDKNFLVHFRIATHGTVDLDNVHPFALPDGGVLAHNGIIHGVDDPKDGRSDTRMFIDTVLPELGDFWYAKNYLNDMVGEWVGWSKFAILDPDGEVWLVNGNKGTWRNGLWYSNDHHFPSKRTTTYKVVNKSASKNSSDPLERAKLFAYEGWDDDEEDWSWINNNYSYTKLDPKNKSDTARKALENARFSIGLFHPMNWDEKGEQWFCGGCYEDVDITGNCLCYDLWDLNCGEIAAECDCTEKNLSDNPWEVNIVEAELSDSTAVVQLA